MCMKSHNHRICLTSVRNSTCTEVKCNRHMNEVSRSSVIHQDAMHTHIHTGAIGHTFVCFISVAKKAER